MTFFFFMAAGLILAANLISMGFAVNTVLKKVSGTETVRYSAIPVMGIAAYSAYLFLTGYFIGLQPYIMALPALLIFIYWRETKNMFYSAKSFILQLFGYRQFILFYIFASIVLILTFLRLFGTRILSDSLVYHLYLPREYIAAGRIFMVPFSEHALWPQLVELFAAFGLTFDGVAAARILSYLSFIGIGLFAFLMVRVLTKNSLQPLLALVFVIATPAYFFYAADTYVDLTIALFTAACVYFLYRYFTGRNTIDLMIAAVSCAGTLSCKYTAIMVFSAALALIIFRSQGSGKLRDAVIFIFITAAFSACWYIWAWLESGNPIFPFGYNIFGKGFAPHIKTEEMSFLGRLVSAGTGRNTGAGSNIINFLMLPFDITFRSHLFGGSKIGYIYLVLFPLFVYAFFIQGGHRILIAFIMLYVAQWFFLGQYIRYLFPVLPLYIAVSLTALNVIWTKWRLPIIFFAVIIPLLAAQTAWSAYYFYQDFDYLFKGTAREESLDPSYRLGRFLADNIEDGGRTLLVGEDRLFYLPSNSIRERAFRNFTHYNLKDNSIEILKENKINRILINTVAGDEDRSGFDANKYFLGQINRTIAVVASYDKDGQNFILCEVK